MNFEGRKIFIVGGTSGVGLQTAKDLLAADAEVVVAGRGEKKLKAALAEIGAQTSGEI